MYFCKIQNTSVLVIQELFLCSCQTAMPLGRVWDYTSLLHLGLLKADIFCQSMMQFINKTACKSWSYNRSNKGRYTWSCHAFSQRAAKCPSIISNASYTRISVPAGCFLQFKMNGFIWTLWSWRLCLVFCSKTTF